MAETESTGHEEPNVDDPFSRLVEQTVVSLRKDILTDRAAEIQQVVYKCVKVILNKVRDLEPRFAVSEILKMGSYFEGTKIDSPDEFDFLLVIKELSTPGAIEVIRKTAKTMDALVNKLPGMVLIKLKDERLKECWERYIVDDYLMCFQQPETYVEHELFGTFVLKAIKELARSQKEWRDGSYNPRSDIDFFLGGLTLSSVDDSIKVTLKTATIGHPNIVLELECDGYPVSIDLSPAIRYDRVGECFNIEDCVDETLAKSVLDRGSILVVAREKSDFRITFTETEVEYMRVKMKKIHKQIYMYLKYVKCMSTKIKRGKQPFSSYVLKMFCIHHDIRCSTETRNISKCFDAVLEVMTKFCVNGGLPNVFNKHLTYMDKRDVEYKYRLCMLDGLKKIRYVTLKYPDDTNILTRVTEIFKECIDSMDFYYGYDEDYQIVIWQDPSA